AVSVLSQEEVDTLLSNISKGTSSVEMSRKGERTIHSYDFRHPDRISKDQLRTLRTIHSVFARSFGTFLSTTLRTSVDMRVTAVDQLTYAEFTMTMSSPSCIYILDLKQLKGNAIFELSPELVFFAIDRLLGGKGELITENREITIIEETVIKKIALKALTYLEEAWHHVTPLEAELQSFETNPQFVQIAPAGEPAVVISIQVKIHNFSSLITLCFPYFVLEPVLPKLSIQRWISLTQKGSSSTDSVLLEKQIKNTTVEVIAKLADSFISVQEFLNLEIGDIINLDKSIYENLTIVIENQPKLYGRPGILGKRLAVQITDVLLKETEDQL
ncbi:MAG: flagellar motor switch protein FliM, partial [candidate division KSB1 bacterium]|nr:flagellar motor switch protein FliM [candidate division KSB1 bacterium]